MELKGELKHFPLAEVALLLEAMSQTGALRITPPDADADELVLHFVTGLITAVDDGGDRSSTRATIRQRLRMRSPLDGRFDFEPGATGPGTGASPGLSSRDLAILVEAIDGDRSIDLDETAFRLLPELPVGRQVLKIDRGGWSQLAALISHDSLTAVTVVTGTDTATVLDWCQTFSSAGLGELVPRAGTKAATAPAPSVSAVSGRHLQPLPDPAGRTPAPDVAASVPTPVPVAPRPLPTPAPPTPSLVPAGRLDPMGPYGRRVDSAMSDLRKELASTPSVFQGRVATAQASTPREPEKQRRSTHSRRAPVTSSFLTRLIAAVRAS
jgi:hypothetical protein